MFEFKIIINVLTKAAILLGMEKLSIVVSKLVVLLKVKIKTASVLRCC